MLRPPGEKDLSRRPMPEYREWTWWLAQIVECCTLHLPDAPADDDKLGFLKIRWFYSPQQVMHGQKDIYKAYKDFIDRYDFKEFEVKHSFQGEGPRRSFLTARQSGSFQIITIS